MIKFLSIDSSLRNTGISWGSINGNEVHIEGILLHQTEKSKNKQVRASSDTIRSCRSTYTFLIGKIKEINPQVIFVETPSGSQSASGMKSYGATCQLIGSIYPPPVEVTPNEAKIASTGNKKATKAEIIKWAYDKYPNLDWVKSGKILKSSVQVTGTLHLSGDNEHCADSIAVVHAGVNTDEFKQLMALLK